MNIGRTIVACLALALSACAAVPASAPAPLLLDAPAAAIGEPFVIAANPLAARAGMEVLERGGGAADAALAVQAMLSLVEPQSSGMGGGGFLNYFDAKSGTITIYDGRETAPAQASARQAAIVRPMFIRRP